MHIDVFAASDCGQRRENNEDHYLIDESLGLYVICDGMGGHAAGEIAADRAIAFAAEYLGNHRDVLEKAASVPDGYFRVLELAEKATREASRRLYQQACSDRACAGMGTTMTMLLVVDNKAVMAHVGDSRLYLLRSGELYQLSADHTLANEMLQAGTLTKDEAAHTRYNHVLTRTIGQQASVQVESLLFDIFPGDTCLLCSDGLSNYFDDRQAVVEFLSSDDLSCLPKRLVDYANSRGGADNITVIVARAMSEGEDIEAVKFQRRIDTLKSTFLCQNFSASRLLRVLNITSLIECTAGQELFSAGQACDGLYLVLEGRLTVDDDTASSNELLPGDSVGESALLGTGTIHANIVAKERSRLLFISRTEFVRLTRRLPKLGNALLRNLCQRLSEQLDDTRSGHTIDPGDTGIWKRGPI